MAKGQIHMGKNGPEKCSVDTANPRSRGCPYEATGHYSSADEALDNYATLNRVKPEELKELVTDGASPKDAVGLLRSGYSKDYLTAASKRDLTEAPDTSFEDKRAEYSEARARVLLRLQEVAPDVDVRGTVSASKGVVLVEGPNRGQAPRYSYAVTRKNGKLELIGKPTGSTYAAEAMRAKIQAAIDSEDSELKAEMEKMLDSAHDLFEEEKNRKEDAEG